MMHTSLHFFVDYTVGGVPNQHRQVTGAIFAIYVTFLLRSVKEVWRNNFYVIKMQAEFYNDNLKMLP